MTRDELRQEINKRCGCDSATFLKMCVDDLTDVPTEHPPEVVAAVKQWRSIRNLMSVEHVIADYIAPQPPQWTPPHSLPSGVYLIGSALQITLMSDNFDRHFFKRGYCDWTDPPRTGRWRVSFVDGKKTATYEGQ